MTTQAQAIALTKANLHTIFSEPNSETRLAALARLWVPSTSSLFIDPDGVYKTHEAISDMIEKLLAGGDTQGASFSELTEVEYLKHDEEADLWVTRVKWGVGPPGGSYAMSGWDIVTIVGGKIQALYTFLEGKP